LYLARRAVEHQLGHVLNNRFDPSRSRRIGQSIIAADQQGLYQIRIQAAKGRQKGVFTPANPIAGGVYEQNSGGHWLVSTEELLLCVALMHGEE
jgi:hypothetical protein